MPREFTPYYQRVIDSITADIKSGRLKPGDRLPTTEQLVTQYGYSAGTIRRAIDALIDAGTLRGHRGVGVFVAERPPQ
jgi:GntR family transcriptional regulator